MHVDHFKPQPDDPLHDSPKGSLIWQFGAKGRRARAYDDIAVLEFGGQCRTGLTCESDLVRLWSHQDYASQSADQARHTAPLSTNSLRLSCPCPLLLAARARTTRQWRITYKGNRNSTVAVVGTSGCRQNPNRREDCGGNDPGKLRSVNT
jgi:hypothetical protein